MKLFKFLVILCQIGILFLLPVDKVFANITEPGGKGVKGIGMGGAVVGTPDDPMIAFYYNPAGLAEVKGDNIVGGLELLGIRHHYRNNKGYSRRNHMTALLPFCGYTTDKLKPVVLGIGMYSSLGTGFNFKKDPAHGIYEEKILNPGQEFSMCLLP